MTIKQTREILGDEIKDLNDEEVLELIKNTGELSDGLLDMAIKDIKAGVKLPKKQT